MSSPAGKLGRIIKLLAYQMLFFSDAARVVVACWCRQAGKDFSSACKAVTNALETGQAWYIVSVTQRQADETFAKCRQIAEAYRAALKLAGRIAYSEQQFVEYDRFIDQHFRCTARTLILPGGGKVVALPGRDPDTLAGLTGNLILTEFALFPNGGYDHWRVIFPLITRGYQILVISTPRGKNTKFNELLSNPQTYSVHLVDIFKAVADGLVLKDNEGRPTTVEAFRKLYADEVGWQREFLCKPTGDLEALIAWAKLEACSDGAPPAVCRVEDEAGWTDGFFDFAEGLKVRRLEMGWDVARTGHLSVLWGNGSGGEYAVRRPLLFLVLMHKTSFALQRHIVMAAMACRPGNVGCGDATGLGMDSNETLHGKFGARWEPVTFTAANRRDLASRLVTAFDDREAMLPDLAGPSKFIQTDLYALQADRGGANLTITESPNPMLPESHCDLAWSAALARRAGSLSSAEPRMWVPGQREDAA